MGEDKRLEDSDLGLGIFYFPNFFPASACVIAKEARLLVLSAVEVKQSALV